MQDGLEGLPEETRRANLAGRLYDRPANDYKWDYPFAYRWQVVLQRGIVLLALAGMAVFTAQRPAVAGVFLVPVALGVLHGLTFPWPRYNQPALPILLAAAGAFVAWLASRAPREARFWRVPGLALGSGALLLLVAAVLFIFGLKGLTHPRTAVRGNLLGALGMLVASWPR